MQGRWGWRKEGQRCSESRSQLLTDGAQEKARGQLLVDKINHFLGRFGGPGLPTPKVTFSSPELPAQLEGFTSTQGSPA